MTEQLTPANEIRVLESFGPPHERTNPYSTQLIASFPPRIRSQYFSWSTALFGDYDVFHLHWPEVKVRGTTPMRSVLRGCMFVLVLLRIRLSRRALVRTLHDASPHEPPNAAQRWVISLSERWTTLWITLNRTTRPPTTAPSRRVPIGHFRDWHRPREEPAVPGRIVHFGLMRQYKGTATLIREFGRIDDPSLSLRIVGAVDDPRLAAAIATACTSDGRVSAVTHYVSDEQLQGEILRSELVVLPFTRITNSSSLLLALSLGRPVLAPAAPSIVEAAEEVGDGWVHTYRGELNATVIESTLTTVRTNPPANEPDLSAREWPLIGELHAEAFDLACQVRHRRHGARGPMVSQRGVAGSGARSDPTT